MRANILRNKHRFETLDVPTKDTSIRLKNTEYGMIWFETRHIKKAKEERCKEEQSEDFGS